MTDERSPPGTDQVIAARFRAAGRSAAGAEIAAAAAESDLVAAQLRIFRDRLSPADAPQPLYRRGEDE